MIGNMLIVVVGARSPNHGFSAKAAHINVTLCSKLLQLVSHPTSITNTPVYNVGSVNAAPTQSLSTLYTLHSHSKLLPIYGSLFASHCVISTSSITISDC